MARCCAAATTPTRWPTAAAATTGTAGRGGHDAAVKHLYGFGYSQTGGYLYDYINAIHPLDVARNGGHPIYDGYIVAVAGAGFVGSVPINQCEDIPHPGEPPLQFSNVGVPVIHVMSQSDYLFALTVRRPDSDAPADRYRHYEMAGAAHATPDELNFSAAPADIIKAGVAVPPMNCGESGEFPRSRFPSHIFFDAMLRNLDLWVRYGIRPPHAHPIATQTTGTPPTTTGMVDKFGNVEGGLRSPYLDVPTSTWFGSTPGGSFCFIAGHEEPFDAATPAGPLRDPRRLRPRRGEGHGSAGGGALHHRRRRPRTHPRGGAGERAVGARRRRPTPGRRVAGRRRRRRAAGGAGCVERRSSHVMTW